jgi:hypothetical protein
LQKSDVSFPRHYRAISPTLVRSSKLVYDDCVARAFRSIYTQALDGKDVIAALLGLAAAVALRSVTEATSPFSILWWGAPAAFILARRAVFPSKPPANVLVQWADGNRYPAVVIGSAPAHLHVAFPDGRKLWVERAYVSPASGPLQAGTGVPSPADATGPSLQRPSVSPARRYLSYVAVLILLVVIGVVLSITSTPVGRPASVAPAATVR